MDNKVLQKECFNAARQFHKDKRKRENNDENSVPNNVKKQCPPNNMFRIQQRQLPIYFGKQGLVNEILRYPTVVVMSETGSGKTTQLPQYLLEAGFAKKGEMVLVLYIYWVITY